MHDSELGTGQVMPLAIEQTEMALQEIRFPTNINQTSILNHKVQVVTI